MSPLATPRYATVFKRAFQNFKEIFNNNHPTDVQLCPRVSGKKQNLEHRITETASSHMRSLIDNFEAYFPSQKATELQSKLWILNVFCEQHPPEHLGQI